jgi:hypothetical protein
MDWQTPLVLMMVSGAAAYLGWRLLTLVRPAAARSGSVSAANPCAKCLSQGGGHAPSVKSL